MDGVEVKHHQKKLRALVCSLNSGEAAYSHMFLVYHPISTDRKM